MVTLLNNWGLSKYIFSRISQGLCTALLDTGRDAGEHWLLIGRSWQAPSLILTISVVLQLRPPPQSGSVRKKCVHSFAAGKQIKVKLPAHLRSKEI